MFLGIFVLNRVSILSFFVLIRVSILSILALKGLSFLGQWTACAYVLRTKLQQNFYLLLSYTGCGFGINVLNRYQKSEFSLKQGRKISDFCLKQGQGIRMRGLGRISRTQGYMEYPPGCHEGIA